MSHSASGRKSPQYTDTLRFDTSGTLEAPNLFSRNVIGVFQAGKSAITPFKRPGSFIECSVLYKGGTS